MKSKNIKIESGLASEIEALCQVLHTNFSTQAKTLFLEWKIEKIAELKIKAPDLFDQYQELVKSSDKE